MNLWWKTDRPIKACVVCAGLAGCGKSRFSHNTPHSVHMACRDQNTAQDAQKGRPARPQRAKRRIVLVPYGEPLNDARTPLADFFRILLVVWMLAGCTGQDGDHLQGYVEGEFVYIASPFAGALESLHVQRGKQVAVGAPLFSLDSTSEKSARDEAERRLAQSRASWEDVKKGKRPSEIDSIRAQLKQVRAAFTLAEREFKRQEGLLGVPGATVELDLDRARSARDQTHQRVAELEAELRTAQLGSRSDQVMAAGAEVRAREAALAKADWEWSQKRQRSPKAGLVFDTLYREGEWVAAGRPVVVLLPPQNIKVRTFVPEPLIGTIQPGHPVRVSVDGISEPVNGTVSYISPKAEYTPPVIYSQESRTKLVFLVEAVFPPDIAAGLHPGQPVDVEFGTAPR